MTTQVEQKAPLPPGGQQSGGQQAVGAPPPAQSTPTSTTTKTQTVEADELAGVAATHPTLTSLPVLVAPATAKEHNTLRPTIIPIACWRVDDVRFEFDSSFIEPEMAKELEALANLIEEHMDTTVTPTALPPLAVFGHADPVGKEEYNKQLAGRRSEALYAMLIRAADRWVKLHDNPHGGDQWGLKHEQIMLKTVGFDPGSNDGKPSDQTTDAVKKFQSGNALGVDGKIGPATRRKLYLAYMDALCTERLKLNAKSDFLARGKDPGGKGDFQGCGESNPALLLSRNEDAEFKKAENKTVRDRENAPNRRVMVFLYRPGTKVDPAHWPCPRASESIAGCKKRFWSDASKRLTLGEERREFKKTQDTFGCRFYHRMSDRSPCEGGLPTLMGLLHMQIFDGEGRNLLTKRKYEIRLAGKDKVRFSGVLNDQAILRHDFVPDGNYLLRIEGCDEESVMVVHDQSDNVPAVRFMETSSLAVFVRSTEGPPIEGATVTVDGIGEKKTDVDGVADFGLTPSGDFNFRVVMEDQVPVRADQLALVGAGESDVIKQNDSASGTVKIAGRKAKPAATLEVKKPGAVIVKEIKAMLPATKTLRATPSPLGISGLADNILPSSTKPDSTPIDNVVLVRGGGEIELEAVTDPPNQPVKWEIVANQSSATPPAITPQAGDTKAKVKTDKAGSFSVVVTGKGGSLLRWNFVLVGVDVDVQNAKVNTRNDFADAHTRITTTPNLKDFNVAPTMVGAMCGVFEFNKHAWDSELTVKLIGGGPKGDIGIDKVSPRYLQNVASPDTGATYSGGARAEAAAKSTTLGRILDCAGGSEPNVPGPVIGLFRTPQGLQPHWPVCLGPGMLKVELPNPADKSVVKIKMGDSPATGFDAHVTKPGTRDTQDALRIGGFLQFVASIACWSTDAPHTVVVHALCIWLVDYSGRVEFPNGKNARAVYKHDFGSAKLVNPWQLVGQASGGLEARQAGLEIFGPTAVSELSKPARVIF